MISCRYHRLFPLALVLACAPLISGCVQRRMTIRSNPPGAQVYVDDYQIGTTPCSASFIYYGTRNIRLEKDGYETLLVKQYIPPPWYQIPPLDFFSENVAPQEIRDERSLNYTLQPQLIVPTDQLLNRAEGLRRATQTTNNPQLRPTLPEAIPLPLPNPTGTMTIPNSGQRIEELIPPPGGAQTLPPQGIRTDQIPQ
jgi:hypothetical protein